MFLATWTLNNTRLLLLSGIGEPYNPETGKGTVGRNLTHQVCFAGAITFFEKPLNRFMGSGAAGMCVSDFDGDSFDHSELPFLRGGNLLAYSFGYKPMTSFGVVPQTVKARWGSEWKKAAIDAYDRTASVVFIGEHLAYKGNYMDLDPTYKDHLGDPLLRMTIDWRDNERKMAEFVTPKAVELARAMGAKDITPFAGYGSYDATRYQTTHVQGGTIMGGSPERSVHKSVLTALADSESFCAGRIGVSAERFGESHTDSSGSRLSRRRCHCGSLLEESCCLGVMSRSPQAMAALTTVRKSLPEPTTLLFSSSCGSSSMDGIVDPTLCGHLLDTRLVSGFNHRHSPRPACAFQSGRQ